MNELKFSIVREDAQIELALIEAHGLENGAFLSVVSGGCTLFEVKHIHPTVDVVGFDLSPFQIEHAKDKKAWIETGDWSVEPDGAFERLFGIFRHVFDTFVGTDSEKEAFFSGDGLVAQEWFSNPYWAVAFKQAFHPDLLFTMFGAAAVQHATRPYASYFRAKFESAMAKPDAAHNPFLQHIFYGHFLERDAHTHRGSGKGLDVSLIEGSIENVPDLSRYDLVSISNVLDWSDDRTVDTWASTLRGMKPGAKLLIRQLNNDRPIERFFVDFSFDEAEGDALLERDRSFFYERILVGTRD